MFRLLKRFLKQENSQAEWYADAVEFFRITPEEACAIGSFKPSSRQEFLESEWGRKWVKCERDTRDSLVKYYTDCGRLLALRQAYYHKDREFVWIRDNLKVGDRLCEYGSGIGPIAFWCVKQGVFLSKITLVDVPGEHLRFGEWRLKKLLQDSRMRIDVDVVEVNATTMPLHEEFDVITIIDVFEHLDNPLEVAGHLLARLKAGGLLWVDFIDDRAALSGTAKNPSNTREAQLQRDDVFALLGDTCRLRGGEKGYIQCWEKR